MHADSACRCPRRSVRKVALDLSLSLAVPGRIPDRVRTSAELALSAYTSYASHRHHYAVTSKPGCSSSLTCLFACRMFDLTLIIPRVSLLWWMTGTGRTRGLPLGSLCYQQDASWDIGLTRLETWLSSSPTARPPRTRTCPRK